MSAARVQWLCVRYALSSDLRERRRPSGTHEVTIARVDDMPNESSKNNAPTYPTIATPGSDT